MYLGGKQTHLRTQDWRPWSDTCPIVPGWLFEHRHPLISCLWNLQTRLLFTTQPNSRILVNTTYHSSAEKENLYIINVINKSITKAIKGCWINTKTLYVWRFKTIDTDTHNNVWYVYTSSRPYEYCNALVEAWSTLDSHQHDWNIVAVLSVVLYALVTIPEHHEAVFVWVAEHQQDYISP